LKAAIPPFARRWQKIRKACKREHLLGLSYYGAGKFADAAKYLAQASAGDPTNAELHNVLAQSCLSAKKLRLRDEGILLDLAAYARLSRVTHVVGEALDGLDKTPEAIAEFEAAAKADSRAPNVTSALATFLEIATLRTSGPAFENEIAVDPQKRPGACVILRRGIKARKYGESPIAIAVCHRHFVLTLASLNLTLA